MGHKVQVSFTNEQWALVKRAKESLGTTDADVVRSIVVAWLSEKSILTTSIKEQMMQERRGK